jgi:lipopolysaccharide/colanic/teichoic acid biosynthesis glycosyltransferase
MQEFVLLVGADAQGAAMASQLSKIPGVKIVGFLDEFLPIGTKINNRFTILGSTRHIDSIAAETGVDTVLMVPNAISWESRQLLMMSSLHPRQSRSWQLHIAPGIYEMASLGAELGRVGNIPVLRLHASSIVGLDAIIKRLVDISTALSLLAVFAIPALTIAAYYKICNRRVIIRTPVRGLNGKLFDMMTLDLNKSSNSFPDGLERLPLLLHVLKGDMSIVGPRPRLWAGIGNGEDRPEMLAVRPGVISVIPRTMILTSTDEWHRLEATYTRNYSIWSDLVLLIRAFVMGLRYIMPIARPPSRIELDMNREPWRAESDA